MSTEKTYTVKDLAELFGVTKSAIQHYLTEQFRDRYVTEVTGKGGKQLRISQVGYEELCSIFKSDKSNKNSTDKFTGKSDKDKEETIKILKQQINEKDKQLERMQLLLNQSQQLQLKESKKLEKLELELKEDKQKLEQKESNSKVNALNESQKEVEENKQGFWSRFFK